MSDHVDLGTREQDLGQTLDDAMREAVALRIGGNLPGPAATVGEVLECLLDVRQRLDRLEELYGNAMRIRAEAQRVLTACRIEVEDAWDAAAVRNRRAFDRDEYSSAKERIAYANLEVLDLRRAERIAERNARRCDEATDFLRLRYHGLGRLRQALTAGIRALQFEQSLDR